ncbi:hypothetical protein [Nocardia salmonicida]|uniref:hypothetical protein n=1 Tax=Nocardia salmonicida TaxID=53431 RepID=UPI002E2C1A4D|nr:hypothetical protein [Nocardia salmonicida]
MKDHSGDHLVNNGVGAGTNESARARKRFLAKHAGKTDMGRDEMFRHRAGTVPKSQRVRLDEPAGEREGQQGK